MNFYFSGFDKFEKIGVAIHLYRNHDNQAHVGIVFRSEDDRVKFIGFRDGQIKVDSLEYWVSKKNMIDGWSHTMLDEYEVETLRGIALAIARNGPDYCKLGFTYKFNDGLLDSDLMIASDVFETNCSSFVCSFFSHHGLKLVNYDTWVPTSHDKKVMCDTSPYVKPKYKELNKEEKEKIFDGVTRVRPEQVACAASKCSSETPLDFAVAEQHGSELMQLLKQNGSR